MPRRCRLNEKRTFSEAFDANVSEMDAALRQSRTELNAAWDGIVKHRGDLEARMVEVGISRPSSSNYMLRLNVGGSNITVRRSVLNTCTDGDGISPTWNLCDLFKSMWDKRIPRDADGRIMLDESPTCVKHLLRALLKKPGAAALDSPSSCSGQGLASDETAYFPHVSRALRMAGQSPAMGIPVAGGSTVLAPTEVGPLTDILQGWCPGNPSRLHLIYRASRDGWGGKAFQERCGKDSPVTITLFRVLASAGNAVTDTIVGGFSRFSWSNGCPLSRFSPDAFIFMLKYGGGDGSSSFQPSKWIPRRGRPESLHTPEHGPCFGSDLYMSLHDENARILHVEVGAFDVSADSPFFTLEGQAVKEIEVFRVCPAATAASPPPPAKPATTSENGLIDLTSGDPCDAATERYDDDVRMSGASIADSLMEERAALRQAFAELAQANTKTRASVNALTAVYAPDVAAGQKDTVVERSVRGTRLTTLRSTLQACPDSAPAARFDEDKWPATDKDMDARGWRVMDCRPSVFSKVLDVLRMRKRAAWGEAGGGDAGVRVVIKAVNRADFDSSVGMYFPGCENFIMDLVAAPPTARP